MKVASRVQAIAKSETIRVKEKALQLKVQGIDVLDLTAGEPDFPTPENICQAGILAIEGGFTKYTAASGIPELRKAVAQKLEKENGLSYDPSQIIIAAGAKPAIATALNVLLEPGQEVIIQAPYWVSYPEQIKLAGGKAVIVPTFDTQFKLTPDLLKQYATPNTVGIIFNSPSNPTGIVYSHEEIAALAQTIQEMDWWVISDEIYEKLIFDGLTHHSIAAFPGMQDRTIVINGVSKAYAMTGWRIGYAAGPLEVIQAMGKIQSHTATATSISQKAALEALTGDQSAVESMRQKFEKRRNFMLDGFQDIPALRPIPPQGAFYVFVDVQQVLGKTFNGQLIHTSLDFCNYLIENEHLVAVPGGGFGAPHFIRLSFANSDDTLKQALAALKRGVERLME